MSLPVESKWSDQTTRPFDFTFDKSVGTPTTVATAPAIGDYDLVVTDATGIIVGNKIGVFTTLGKFYFGVIISVATNTLTLDTSLDYAFPIGSTVVELTDDLSVDGSATPQEFVIRGPAVGNPIDITRILLTMTTTDAPVWTDFGDITNGLTNGIVLRHSNGEEFNIWNIKQNSDFYLHAYDVSFLLATGPQGVNGLTMRYTFAGPDKHGVAIRLSEGDYLKLIIQDNLSSLLTFKMVAEGHFTN